MILDIKAFIRELLFEHDCVIVPGFGAFIGNFTSARVDAGTNTFYPPVKQISFNRNLVHNDGLLIGRISQSTGLNYSDVRSLVEEFVKGIRLRLSKGEQVVFDHIGTFFNNAENSIQFEPESNINYYLDSYGLESFQLKPVKGYDIRKRVIRHIDKDPVRRTTVKNNVWKSVVLIPLLALLIAIPLKNNLFRDKTDSASMNPLVTAEFENNRKAIEKEMPEVVMPSEETTEATTEVTTKVTTEVTPSVTEADYRSETVSEKPAEVAPAAGSYCIITGSFKSEENANSHIAELKSLGFTPELVTTSNGFFRVISVRCSDIRTALSKMDTIGKKFPGAWISKP